MSPPQPHLRQDHQQAQADALRYSPIDAEILGVNKDADQNSIKKAFYKLAQQYHPDKNSAANAKEKFAEINK